MWSSSLGFGPHTACVRSLGCLDHPAVDPTFVDWRGQRSAEDLVDRYPVRHRAMRDLFVDYLLHRSAPLDHSTLESLSRYLVLQFWYDIEANHPHVSSLDLPLDAVRAWKQCIRVLPDGRPRQQIAGILFAVRARYVEVVRRYSKTRALPKIGRIHH